MSRVYLYDGSFEGMLSAVALAVKTKEQIRGVFATDYYRPLIFDTTVLLSPDHDQAGRLLAYYKTHARPAVTLAIAAFLCENEEAATQLYMLTQRLLDRGPGVLDGYSDAPVVALKKLSAKVSRESHRFKGLLRFVELPDGILYAYFEPDHNVIGYLVKHFTKRLAGCRWVIHDLRRDLAYHWDGNTVNAVEVPPEITAYLLKHGRLPGDQLADREEHYQALWQSFHENIAISARKNPGLQRNHMPVRYWKYLVEGD
jgi:probable DNA metabolism protein